MKISGARFNLYLCAAFVPALVCGCKTEEKMREKALTSIRVHVETNRDPMGRSKEITVGRDNPVKLTVDKNPFLTEAQVKEAKVADVVGGFALEVQLDHEGTMLLEQYTRSYPGRHLAIFCQFCTPPEEKLNEGRWLAAPRIVAHIADGRLAFTPDATREEADQIVLGLNNVAKRVQLGKPVRW